MGVRIIGTGSYVPEKILTNADLEKMVDTSDDWITTRTGIKERRVAKRFQATSDMGVEAALRALDMAKIKAEDIDLIIVATVTPDTLLPSTACHIQRKINALGAACFDFQAACSGFIYGLDIVVALMKYNRKFKNALLISGEKLSAVTDWEDRNTCVLFGDAAGAVVVSKTKNNFNTLLSNVLYADGTYADLLTITGGGSLHPLTKKNINDKLQYIKMEGNKVFKLAVNAMVSSCKEALDLACVNHKDIKWLIPHQANLRIIHAVGERLGISSEKVCINLDQFGNTSAASIMLSLDELVRGGKITAGDKILITAFGGGMTWGASVLNW